MKTDDQEFNYLQNNKKEEIENLSRAIKDYYKELKISLILGVVSLVIVLSFILIVSFLWVGRRSTPEEAENLED